MSEYSVGGSVLAVLALGVAVPMAWGRGAPACGYQTSILEAFDAQGAPEVMQQQSPAAAWTYRRSDMGRALLVGFQVPGYPAGSWGSPDQSFGVPLVGPRYSPIPARNQVAAYARPPSFEGIFFHPGYTPIDAIAELKPQATVLVEGLTVRVELLGAASPNVIVTARIERAGGNVVLIAPTSVVSLAPALTLTAPSNLFPQVLHPGDRLVVVGNNGGDPSADWANLNATVTLEGPPIITVQPGSTAVCSRGAAELRVVAPGATGYQWRHAGLPIPGARGATLPLGDASLLDDGAYDCIVTNDCGSVTSTPATVSVCIGDFNCDGGVDGADVDAFFAVWEAGDAAADVNADGGVDGGDIDTFFQHWENGC